MKLNLWQIDAFAENPFEGNPAAVVPLESWLDDGLLQKIANENNLAETAFFVREAPGRYGLRWFTPTVEVPLCGHATLASSWLIFSELAPERDAIVFETRSGTLEIARGADGRHTMSFPADAVGPYDARPGLAAEIAEVLHTRAPVALYTARKLMAVFDEAAAVRDIPGPGDIQRLLPPGMDLIVTAPGDEGFDFVSRFFAPHHGIPEDPVTGGAHCTLAPYWAKRLGKTALRGRQVSPRGGTVLCATAGNRVLLSGTCALYLTGQITV
jgi:predicted PhzF superfamily epimerase YddE/YHI9